MPPRSRTSRFCWPASRAANRIDLLRPYLDTYRRLMPEAVAATRRRGFSGMLWIDQHDYLGRQVAENAPSFKDNHTPASQIAMFFWWHYLSRRAPKIAFSHFEGGPGIEGAFGDVDRSIPAGLSSGPGLPF